MLHFDWHYNEIYQYNTVRLLEQFIHTDTVDTEKDKMASVGKIGHTDASQESEQEPVFSPKSDTMCINQPTWFNENMNTFIPYLP